MANTPSIVAPPYHAQSTAAELRFGFPCFSYHESVSKLWSEKWRPPCSHGIYPFTDGKVEDFDPIFAALVKASNDSSDILSRPDEYARPFFPVAEKQGQPEFSMERSSMRSRLIEWALRLIRAKKIFSDTNGLRAKVLKARPKDASPPRSMYRRYAIEESSLGGATYFYAPPQTWQG